MAKDMIKNLKDSLDELPPNWVIMLETAADHTVSAGAETVQYLTGKGMHGIVVSISQPCTSLKEHYEEEDIDMSAVNVVDCVTKTETTHPPEIDNVVYVQNPAALTDMSIQVKGLIRKLKKEGKDVFVMIDSVDSLLIHNKPETVAQFIHGLLTKVRVEKVSAVVLTVAGSIDASLRAKIVQLCDKVVVP